jgi:hypothetical protein
MKTDTAEMFSQDFADCILSPADIVSRAYRITRKDWKVLALVSAIPAFVYIFSYSMVGWLAVHSGIGVSNIVALLVIDLFVAVGSGIALRVIQFALVSLLLGQYPSLQIALTESGKKIWLIFWISLPSGLVDVAVFILCALSVWLMVPGLAGGKNTIVAGVGAIIYCGLVLITVPFNCLMLLNLFFICILIAERLSVRKCFIRFINFCASADALGYMACFFSLFAIVSFSVDMCTALLTTVNLSGMLPPGVTKEISKTVELLLNCALSMPFNAFLTGAAAAGCAGLYSQLTMKLEGADLVTSLDLLKHS